MRAITARHSLRTVLLVLQSALLAAIVAVGTTASAPAQDCDSFVAMCVDEVVTVDDYGTLLTVRPSATVSSGVDKFNFIGPGLPQQEVPLAGSVTLRVKPDGTVTYSFQACLPGLLSSDCLAWRQVTRHFAPTQACHDYTTAAVGAIKESDSLGCGFSGPGRWDHDPKAHMRACLGYVGDWQGFVNNETNLRASDLAACKARIAAANQPPPVIKSTGKAAGSGPSGPSTPAEAMSCQGGGAMRVTNSSQSSVLIAFTQAAQPASAAPPGPGECAWQDRPFAPGEASRLGLSLSQPNAQLLLDAVRGGTFNFTGSPNGSFFIMVGSIANVQVADSTPLSPGPTNAGKGGDTGIIPMQQADGSCRGGTATIVINQPGLDKLNVRNGPGGQVIGTVPEGGTVSVIGPCGATSGAAGFAKPTTQPGGGGDAGGWCQIGAPVHGCVLSQFLQFGGGAAVDTGLPNGAAGFAKPAGKQAMTPATTSFSGRWRAKADNVAYTLVLNQNGSSVTGSFNGSDGSAGTLGGRMQGGVLRFSWSQQDGTRGTGQFTLSADGRSFAGSYTVAGDPSAAGAWNGTRQ